ncbi:MAG TPA: hypothetical protein VMY43_03980 [Methanothrix sp.]|nr:hypothetical protein [Methanothrix sp.]
MLKYSQGIVTVHMVGPVHLLQGLPTPEDIGIFLTRMDNGADREDRSESMTD